MGQVICVGNFHIIYTLKKRPIVINLSPHIPYDLTNEISCHSILLMHFPWSLQGEAALVLSETITSVKNILKNDMFPNYIKETLDKYIANSDVQENEKRLYFKSTRWYNFYRFD